MSGMNKYIVYLVRHGSPHYSVDPLGRRLVYGPSAELSDEGKMQCARLARGILQREGGPLDILITSPYTRAQQTATILADEMKVSMVLTDDRLRDTRSTWEGTLVDDFMTTFYEGKTFDDPRTLETLEELGERMKAAYDEILARFGGKSIGIVSHGDPIRALYFRLNNPQGEYPPYPELVKMISLGSAEGVRIQMNPGGGLRPNIEIISRG